MDLIPLWFLAHQLLQDLSASAISTLSSGITCGTNSLTHCLHLVWPTWTAATARTAQLLGHPQPPPAGHSWSCGVPSRQRSGGCCQAPLRSHRALDLGELPCVGSKEGTHVLPCAGGSLLCLGRSKASAFPRDPGQPGTPFHFWQYQGTCIKQGYYEVKIKDYLCLRHQYD